MGGLTVAAESHVLVKKRKTQQRLPVRRPNKCQVNLTVSFFQSVNMLSNNRYFKSINLIQQANECCTIHTIHIDAFIDMLYTIMCAKYHRIEVEFGARTKWTVHMRCDMFGALSICAPDWIIVVFRAFHSHTRMRLTNNQRT